MEGRDGGVEANVVPHIVKDSKDRQRERVGDREKSEMV